MEKVIKSIINSVDNINLIDYLLDPEVSFLLSNQEKDVFKFLKESYDNSGEFPSEDYLVKKFIEYKVPLSKASVLSANDLKVHLLNLISKRKKLNISRELMKIANEVSDTGLTYEHLDSIRKYVVDAEIETEDTIETEESFKEFYNSKKELPKGIQTFIKDIDSKIGGIPGGFVSVLAGYVGSYKSTLATNIVYNNAKKLDYNICYISLEVSKEDLMYNFLCRHSFENKFTEYNFIPHDKIRKCQLTEEEESYLFNTVLPDFYRTGGMIKILDETDFKTLSFSEIREKLEKVDDEMMEKTGYPLDAVVWDHANLLKFNGKRRSNSEGSEINEYISFIRKLSISFRKDKETGLFKKLAMLVLAQVNRDGWKRAVKNRGCYDLRALSEANEFERAAQVIMTIFTDENMKMAKEATVQLLKNRFGQTNVEPISIFADPEAYVIGDEMEGFNDMLSTEDLDSVFGSGVDLSQIF